MARKGTSFRLIGPCILQHGFFVAFLSIALLSTGCSSQYKTYPITGTVKFEDKPLVGGGSIQLIPLEMPEAVPPGGEIRPDGTYFLRTYAEADGAPAGKFRVIIRQNEILQPAVYGEAKPAVDGSEQPLGPLISPEKRVPSDALAPKIYSTPDSPIIIEVEKKKQDITISLRRNPE